MSGFFDIITARYSSPLFYRWYYHLLKKFSSSEASPQNPFSSPITEAEKPPTFNVFGRYNHQFELDTSDPNIFMPCGYFIRVYAWDHTIYNSRYRRYRSIHKNFCILKKEPISPSVTILGSSNPAGASGNPFNWTRFAYQNPISNWLYPFYNMYNISSRYHNPITNMLFNFSNPGYNYNTLFNPLLMSTFINPIGIGNRFGTMIPYFNYGFGLFGSYQSNIYPVILDF